MDKTAENPQRMYKNPVLDRASRNRRQTERISQTEYYSVDDLTLDADAELVRISDLPKSLENLQRIDNLKRIRTVRNWFGQWFENDLRTDCRQFVKHTNYVFYWPWHPETVIVDTLFIDIFPDGTVTKKLFQGHPFLIDTAESHYAKVTGRNTLKKLERLESSEEIEIIRFDKLM